VAKGAPAQKKKTDSRPRGPLYLALAWGLLIVVVGMTALVNSLFKRDHGPRSPVVELAFVAIEPEPPPPPAPPPAVVETPPAEPQPVEVPVITSRPAVEEPPSATPAPAQPPAMAAPRTVPTPPRPRPDTSAAAPPAPTPPPAAPAPAAQPPAATPAAPTGAALQPQVAMGGAPAAVLAAPAAPKSLWQRLATPFDENEARPRVAVVIVDLGLSSAATEAAIQHLPPAVTLSFSPYADNLEQWINLARAAGHEVMLGLPMEPANLPARDPGPRTLLTSLTPRQNLERLDWVLGRVSGYVGVTNHMGSRFTASADALRPVLTTLRERGLMFVDSRTTPRSVAAGLATTIGLPRAINDRMIDNEASRAAIDAMLADVERVARETGNAVAMGQTYPVTFERLNTWLPTLNGKGLVLAPITALVDRQPDR
jgi:polysaccharide deacetylase 2 family uncharacterized protein YibQ